MKTQSEIQKMIVEVNKKITKTHSILNNQNLFSDGCLWNDKQQRDLKNVILALEDWRTDLSQAKRLLSRLERIQKLEAQNKSLKEIADEWEATAREMIDKQEIRIKSAVIKEAEKKAAIHDATFFYHSEIKALKFLKNEK